MRKMIIATTLTLVLAGTTAAAAPRDRESGRGRGRDETPMVRFVKAVQRLFGVGTFGLPSVPIP
jgi:hypothetical protein